MLASGEQNNVPDVWKVLDKDGKIIKLVEADTKKQVRDYLLNGVTIEKASALTVARAGVSVEKA